MVCYVGNCIVIGDVIGELFVGGVGKDGLINGKVFD